MSEHNKRSQKQPDNFTSCKIRVNSRVSLKDGEINVDYDENASQYHRHLRTQNAQIKLEELERARAKREKNREKEMKKKGIRIPLKWGILVLTALTMVCGIILLVVYANGVGIQNNINTISETLSQQYESNQSLQAQVDEAFEETNILKYANENMEMHPRSSAECIEIDALDYRNAAYGEAQ